MRGQGRHSTHQVLARIARLDRANFHALIWINLVVWLAVAGVLTGRIAA